MHIILNKKQNRTMSLSKTKHEIDKVRQLESNGFTTTYIMDQQKLKNVETSERFRPNQVKIVEEARYEGMSDPSDMSILYAIETTDGNRGVILTPYGPSADSAMVEFMLQVEASSR
jgi:hypothetical protein